MADLPQRPRLDRPQRQSQPSRSTGSKSASPRNLKDVQQLQRLAGNAAVSRLIASGPQRTGAANPAGGIGNSGTGVGEARSAFLKLAAAAVAARGTSARSGESANRQNAAATRSSDRIADRQEAITQSQAAGRDAKANGAASRQAPGLLRPAVRTPAEVADKIAPDQAPAAVAGQAAALRAPADALAVPLEEAGGHGQESERALGELSSYAESHPGLVGLGTAISERIGGLRQRAVANAQQATGELRSSANNERGVVQDAIRTNHDAVKGTIRTSKAQLEQATVAGHGRVEAQADDARKRSDAISAEETERVATTVGTGRQQARQIFGDARSHIGEAGDTERGRVQTHAQQQANHVLELGRQQAQQERRTEEDADLAADKADAVMDVANDYAGRLREDGTELAASLPKQAGEAKEQVSSEEDPTVEGLGQTADSATEGIRSLMNSVRLGVNSVALQGHQQLGAAQTSLSHETDNLEQAAAGRAEAMRAEGLAAVDAGLAAGIIAHAKIAGQAGQLLDEAGRDAIAVLTDNAATAAASGPVIARQTAPGSPPRPPHPAHLKDPAHRAARRSISSTR
jgi:hypothetical protein